MVWNHSFDVDVLYITFSIQILGIFAFRLAITDSSTLLDDDTNRLSNYVLSRVDTQSKVVINCNLPTLSDPVNPLRLRRQTHATLKVVYVKWMNLFKVGTSDFTLACGSCMYSCPISIIDSQFRWNDSTRASSTFKNTITNFPPCTNPVEHQRNSSADDG